MKHLIFISLACLAVGCKHNEFDVTTDQIAKLRKEATPGKAPFLDMNHLPPGTTVHTIHFKKGEQLPDGRIADKDMDLKRIETTGTASTPGKPPAESKVLILDDKASK